MDVSELDGYRRRLGALKNERASYITHWQEINQFLLPRRGRFFSAYNPSEAGNKINQKIIDSEATFALNTLSSGMMSGVTSPVRRWFRLVTPDLEMMEFGPVKDWLHRVEMIMYQVYAGSNLYQVLPYIYEEMGAYGTAAMIQLDDFDDISRFQAFSIGEYCLTQDHRYMPNGIYREVKMTVEQIVGGYGVKPGRPREVDWTNISAPVKSLYDKGAYDHWVDTIHVIQPNFKYDSSSKYARDKAFSSCVFEAAGGEGKALEESGYDKFPVYAPRWHLQPPEVYGRSPGMDALGDVKQLQDQQKKKGIAIAKHVNPPMTGPSSLKDSRKSTLPGDITYIDTANGRQGFVPAYTVEPRLQEFLMDMQDVRARIRRVFYTDLFLMLAQSDRREITAREIDERKEEKLLMLGPVLQRINHDLLDPLVRNTFDRLLKAGVFRPPPMELQGQQLKIEYISIMAQAQKAQGIMGISDTAGFVGNLAQFNPETVDKFDFDQAVDEYADMRGVPPGIVRTDDEVAQLRQARANKQQRADVLAAASQAAESAKTLSDTDTTTKNALTDTMGAIANAGAGAGLGRGGAY